MHNAANKISKSLPMVNVQCRAVYNRQLTNNCEESETHRFVRFSRDSLVADLPSLVVRAKYCENRITRNRRDSTLQPNWRNPAWPRTVFVKRRCCFFRRNTIIVSITHLFPIAVTSPSLQMTCSYDAAALVLVIDIRNCCSERHF